MHNILRKIRRDQGLTQAEIAKMLGVSRSCVANWETGVREADILIIRKYNELFGYKEEILDVFRKIKDESDCSLNITIFNTQGRAEIMKKYTELKNNPKYLKNP